MQNKIYRADVAIVISTNHTGEAWGQWLRSLQQQTIVAARYVFMDHHANEQAVMQAIQAGFEAYHLNTQYFSPLAFQQCAAQQCAGARYIVYLDQSTPLDDPCLLERLLVELEDDRVAVVYDSQVCREESRHTLPSFCAYQKAALQTLDNFVQLKDFEQHLYTLGWQYRRVDLLPKTLPVQSVEWNEEALLFSLAQGVRGIAKVIQGYKQKVSAWFLAQWHPVLPIK